VKGIVRWLLAPSSLPDAPPLWLVVVIFGIVWNLFAGPLWVAALSVPLAFAAYAWRGEDAVVLFFRRMRLSMRRRRR